MIFLWNPTQEDMHFSYGGLSYVINAGKRMKVEEAMGKHVLNNLTARGMSKLIFDDDGRSVDEDKIAADAIERNKEFKIRQVVSYNERNERRKASGQPYDVPTKEVKQYAAELGIDLLQPYTMAEGEKGQIGKLSQENQDLRSQVNALATQMQELIKQLANKAPVVEEKKKNGAYELFECGICGEMVLSSKMRSHISYYHNIKKEIKNESQSIPI